MSARKRLPTRAEFDRLARLIYLLDAAYRELICTPQSIGYFLPVRWVDKFGSAGPVGKTLLALRGQLEDLACQAEANPAAARVMYGNRAAEELAARHVRALLDDPASVLPAQFFARREA